jgi:hypothetical protein
MNKSNINEQSAGTEADSNSTAQNQQVSQPNANTNVGRILVKKKVWIKHIDGISTVLAKAIIGSGEVEFEYKFEGMVYGQTLSVKQCIEFGYINKVRANNNFREMKKDTVYPIIRFYYAEDDVACAKGSMIVGIPVNDGMHVSNFEAVF